MTISFGETFDKVRECFTEQSIIDALIPKLQSVTIIRDVNGKIRIYLEPSGTNIQESEIADLNNFLSTKLGKYYGNDIWLPAGDRDPYKALIKTIEDERISASWDEASVLPRWYILERHIAKQAWTDRNVGQPPWTDLLVEQKHKPAIVSFFSFKGGVGRTSTLVATALTLARNGHRVAIVDLDLEAPGLATIFSPDNSDNQGVIDYLLEKKIQGNDWRLRIMSINEQKLLGDDGQSLQLLPAGTVDKNYLEKLARLDFQNLVDGGLQGTLQNMLKELESAVRPLDFILMDARAGFHDIGGLAISSLSHAAVIFGTQSRQSWAGLTHVIRHLASASADVDERLPLILVHSMAPAIGISGRETELREFRDLSYIIFQENYYSEDETVPDSNNREEPFFPIVVPYQESLRGDIALFSRNSTPEESNRLSDLVDIMTNSTYRDIAEKLCRLFGRSLIQ
jgi:MinD-like ATPase involved in chromosome partitioning or flagellar assembly